MKNNLMKVIDLQEKTSPKEGKIELYWFENEFIGLKRTLFHRFLVPLEKFDSGIEYEAQPTETRIVMEWFNLKLKNPTELDGVELTTTPDSEEEISIYLGSAHNPCDIKTMKISKISDAIYEINCELFIDFEYESVAKNENFRFTTTLRLDSQIQH